jgi:hypothetical protein
MAGKANRRQLSLGAAATPSPGPRDEISPDDEISDFESSSDDVPPDFSTDADPLVQMLVRSDLDSQYQATTFTQDSQPAQPSPVRGPILSPKPQHQNPLRKAAGRPGPKQRRIFDFAEPTNEADPEGDGFSETVAEIYRYFHRQKKVLVILTALHQASRNVRAAIDLLRTKGFEADARIDFRFSTAGGNPEDTERYFK